MLFFLHENRTLGHELDTVPPYDIHSDQVLLNFRDQGAGQISQTFDFKEVELLHFTLRSPVNST